MHPRPHHQLVMGAVICRTIGRHSQIVVDRRLAYLVVPPGNVECRNLDQVILARAVLARGNTLSRSRPIVVAIRMRGQVLPQLLILDPRPLRHVLQGQLLVPLLPVAHNGSGSIRPAAATCPQKVKTIRELKRARGVHIVIVVVRRDLRHQRRQAGILVQRPLPLDKSQVGAPVHTDLPV